MPRDPGSSTNGASEGNAGVAGPTRDRDRTKQLCPCYQRSSRWRRREDIGEKTCAHARRPAKGGFPRAAERSARLPVAKGYCRAGFRRRKLLMSGASHAQKQEKQQNQWSHSNPTEALSPLSKQQHRRTLLFSIISIYELNLSCHLNLIVPNHSCASTEQLLSACPLANID